jgi:LuxR family maltose regulon positive regulatory protein
MTTTINESEPAAGEAGGIAMPPARPQFLEGKLNIPEPHFPVLRRRRITSLIDHATRNRVTLISGPAGAGKTVACASWAGSSTQARRLVWLTADSGDQQGWFWSYVCAGLQRLRAIPPELLRSLENSSPDRFPLRLVEAAQAFTEPVTLVLDDVHELTDQAVLAGLDVLTRHAPPTLRLVLLARQPPALQLARLRVSGDLADIGGQDLACTPEEAGAYFAMLGLDVDTAARDQLLRRTQGWMAGLRLAALRADADPQPGAAITDLAGDEPIVTDYLWDEVLGKQLPATRMFLLRTSITSEVTGELADALTGQSGSARTLERLSRENSFVEVTDRERGGYVYHPLLREVLAAELHREIPHEIPVLLRRAARWYAANDQPIASVRCAAEAQDWDYAAQILAEAGAGLAAPGSTGELESVLGLFPADRSADDPAVAAAWAAARLWDGDEEGAAGYLESGERALGRAAPAMRRMMEPALAALRVMLAGYRTDPDPGLLAAATEIAARAEAAAATQPEHRAAGLTWFAVGVARLRRWEIQQARHALRHADRQLAAGSLAALQARARAWRALAEAACGDLTAARRSASDVPGVPSGLPPGGRSAAAPGSGPMSRGALAGGSALPGSRPAKGAPARPGATRGPAAGGPAGGGPGRARLAGDRASLPGTGSRSAWTGPPGTPGVPAGAGLSGMRPGAGALRGTRAAEGLRGAGLAGAGLAGAGLAGAGLAGAGQAAEVAVLARALVSLRRDELSAAQRLVEIVSQEAAGQFPGEPSVSAVAALIRARVLLADGDATAAAAVLSRLRETWGPSCPALADVITVAEGEVALRVGNTGRARAVLLLVEESDHFDRADAWLLRGGLLIADGDFKAALEAVAPGLDGAQDQVTLHERICGLLVAAVAHRRLGSTEEAATLLEQALALAEPDGAYRAFLDGGAAVRSAMTVLIPPTSRHAGFAGRILERFDAQAPRGGPAVERISVPLTDSERAVLCFLPSHMTNEEISQALFLSINTVKTHLRSAYRKLGVSSRREAIARGRRLGLL